jgi:hypothetical protein
MSNHRPTSEATGTPLPPTNCKTARLTDKDPVTKLARPRLSVLQLAQELGSVSRDGRQAGILF